MKRKTDNTPVTDESLARMRDEIAEAYSHASHETDSLIAAIDAGDMANVIAREKEIDALRSQLDEAESYRERMIALTAQRDALRGALELIAGKGWSSLCVASAAEEMHTVAVSALAIADGAE